MASLISLILYLNLGLAGTLLAADPSGEPLPTGPEEVDIENIKQRYWARGKAEQMGVVQNRIYTKERKFELGLAYGGVAGDPLLEIRTLNLSVGYHFSEVYSLHFEYGKAFVDPSSALKTMPQFSLNPDTNAPRSFFGTEARASFLYGKLNLLGRKILYLDAYFCGGLGVAVTESGSNGLISFGVGQKIQLSHGVALNIAYKGYWYDETLLSKVSGLRVENRSNLSHAVLLGVSVTLDPLSSSR